jgi:hypothetical protein
MAYSKTTWVDDSAPALDAAHLNNIEDGIENLDGRVTANESTLTTHTNSINSNTTEILTIESGLNDLEADLNDMVIIRRGTFSGNWQPTLTSTFGITNNTDYNWTVSVHQTSRTTTNGHVVTLEGYLTADNDTLQFTSTDNAASVAAYYTLVGYRKTFSNAVIVNQ